MKHGARIHRKGVPAQPMVEKHKSDLALTFDVRQGVRASPLLAHYSADVSRCQVQFVRLAEARRNDEPHVVP